MSVPASWGISPPPSPFTGMPWVNTNFGTLAPHLFVFEGEDWIDVGTWTVGTGFVVNTTGPYTIPSVASATSTVIATAGGLNNEMVVVTGTVTITGMGAVPASPRDIIVIFAGALTFTHNAASLQLPGSANITTAVGDVALMRPIGNSGSNWRCVSYVKAAF